MCIIFIYENAKTHPSIFKEMTTIAKDQTVSSEQEVSAIEETTAKSCNTNQD